jgi:hypothetical protein
LIAGFRFVGFELADERGRDLCRQHLREIHDAACERRHVERKRKSRED